jgi:hypothetical protein
MTMPRERVPRLPNKEASRQVVGIDLGPPPSGKNETSRNYQSLPSSPLTSGAKTFSPIMFLALATALFLRPAAVEANKTNTSWSGQVPDQAQRVYPKDFAVLSSVLPPSQSNISTVRLAFMDE